MIGKKPLLTIIIPVGKGLPLYVVESIKKQTIPVKYIIETGDNPSANRNRGIKKVKTPYIAFVNAHSILPPTWAAKVVALFKKHPKIDVAGGPQLTPADQNYFGRVSGYALSSLFGAAQARQRYLSTKFTLKADEEMLTSANLACRAKVCRKVLFNETIYPGEDPLFIADAQKAGFNIAYDPEIIIYHKRRENLSTFAYQMFRYGVTRPQKESLPETLTRPLFLIPAIFVIYLIFLPFFTLLNSLFAFPAALYLGALFFFSLTESVKHKDFIAFFVLPLIFLTIHLGYGMGFIYGIYKYRIRL